MSALAKLAEYAMRFGPDAYAIVKEIVEAFEADHPEMSAPPPAASKVERDARVNAKIREYFRNRGAK